MSDINELILFEKKKHKDEKLPTEGHVGAGYGKTVGSLGGPVGYAAGYYIGKHHLMDHPKKTMNKHSAVHRFGAMLDNSTKLKNLGIRLGGAIVGAGIGAGVAKHTSSHKLAGNIGGSIGASVGGLLAHHLIGAGRDNRKLAKKLGYGRFGRVAASVTPITGLFKPKSQREDDE